MSRNTIQLIQSIIFITVVSSSLSDLTKCRPAGWDFKPYQEVLFAADIVLYGRDVSAVGECPPGEKTCDYPHREHSRFRVFCVLKGDGSPINQDITIEPEKYWDNCTGTRFSNSENGWEYVVGVKRGQNGAYYWDETHKYQAAYHKAHPDIDIVLQEVTKMCGIQNVAYPANRTSTKKCPKVTVTDKTCTHACHRGWTKSADSTRCYWISSVDDRHGRNDASLKCAGEYAHLLSINSAEEQSFIGKQLVKEPETEWWTSGKRIGDRFLWDDQPGGTPFSTQFRNQWRPTQPDNEGGNQDYVTVLYTDRRYGWSDNNGSLSLPYICEKAIELKEPTGKCNLSTSSEKEIKTCLAMLLHTLAFSTNFWFGDSFKERCQADASPMARSNIDCLMLGKTPSSLIERLFGKNNFATTSLRQLLHVTITAQSGTIYSCNQTKRGSAKTTQLDPIDIPTISSWNAREGSTLSIKWTPEDNTMYGLVIVDAGLLSIRGMWVNIQGDKWESGKVLKDYSGSTSPFVTIANPVVFLLYKQESTVYNVSSGVKNMLENDINMDNPVSMTTLSTQLDLKGPIAMNTMLVKSDSYSAGYDFKPSKPVDLCNIETQKAAHVLRNPLISRTTQFSLTMHVRYATTAMKFTVCCKGYTYSANDMTINPMANGIIDSHLVRETPDVEFRFGGIQLWKSINPLPDQLYTLLMVDQSLKNENVGTESKPFVHWAITNFKIDNSGKMEAGDVCVPYMHPQPANQEKHTYTFLLFKQEKQLAKPQFQKYSTAETCQSGSRCLFDVNSFSSSEYLTLTSASWFRVKTDPYVIYSRTKRGMGTAVQNCKMLNSDIETVGNNVVCQMQSEQVSFSVRVAFSRSLIALLLFCCYFL